MSELAQVDPKSVAALVSKKSGLSTPSELVSFNESPIGKRVVRLTDLKWKPDDEKLPKSVIVKLIDTADDQLKIADQREMKLCAKFDHDLLPKPFGRSDDGNNIVYQDYMVGSTRTPDGWRYTLAEVLQITKLLAKLHARTIIDAEFSQDLVYQARSYGRAKAKTLLQFAELDISADMTEFRKMCQEDEEITNALPPELLSRVPTLDFDIDELMMALTEHGSIELPDVLVHGDLTSENVILKTDESGSATDQVAAIDHWQCLHLGNPMFDVTRLIAFAESDVRRSNLDFVLDEYRKALATELNEETCPFTPDQFSIDFRMCAKLCQIMALSSVPRQLKRIRESKTMSQEDKENYSYEVLELTKELLEDIFERLDELEFMGYVNAQTGES